MDSLNPATRLHKADVARRFQREYVLTESNGARAFVGLVRPLLALWLHLGPDRLWPGCSHPKQSPNEASDRAAGM
jgi:hypothetical protein